MNSTDMTVLPMPYQAGGSPWVSDKQTARVRGFLTKYLALGLPLPDDVAAALDAHRRVVNWAGTPRPDADQARHDYREALTDAATSGAKPPSPTPVITALAKADASREVARDTASVSEELHLRLMGAVLANLDEMTTVIVTEHDTLMAAARSEADRLPASVRSADAAVTAGPTTAAAWLALTDIGSRLMKVRDTRLRAASLDGTRYSIDYALFRHPDRFPKDDVAPTSDALRVLDLIVDRHGVQPWCPTVSELAEHVEQERVAGVRRRQGPESARGRYVAPQWQRQP